MPGPPPRVWCNASRAVPPTGGQQAETAIAELALLYEESIPLSLAVGRRGRGVVEDQPNGDEDEDSSGKLAVFYAMGDTGSDVEHASLVGH